MDRESGNKRKVGREKVEVGSYGPWGLHKSDERGLMILQKLFDKYSNSRKKLKGDLLWISPSKYFRRRMYVK